MGSVSEDVTEESFVSYPSEIANPMSSFSWSSVFSHIWITVLFFVVITCAVVVVSDRVFGKKLSKLTAFVTTYCVSSVAGLVSSVLRFVGRSVLGGGNPKTSDIESICSWLVLCLLLFIPIVVLVIRNLWVSANVLMDAFGRGKVMAMRPAKLGFGLTLAGTTCMFLLFFCIPIWLPLLLIGHKFTKQARGMMACKKPTLTRVGNLGG